MKMSGQDSFPYRAHPLTVDARFPFTPCVELKSPDRNLTAILFAPRPDPATSVADWITSVVPSEMNVTPASINSWSKMVVQPRYDWPLARVFAASAQV